MRLKNFLVASGLDRCVRVRKYTTAEFTFGGGIKLLASTSNSFCSISQRYSKASERYEF